MKIIYKLLLSVLFASAACVHTDARFIEQGKEWTYLTRTYITQTDCIYLPFTCKIEDTTTINGNEYAVVKAYFGNNANPENAYNGDIYAYVRESAHGEVYVIPQNMDKYPEPLCSAACNDHEYLMFSLANPLVIGWSLEDYAWDNGTGIDYLTGGAEWRKDATVVRDKIYSPSGNILNSWYFENRPQIKLVENIGYMGNSNLTIFYSMLTGIAAHGSITNLGLLTVKDGDGNILYINNELDNLLQTEGIEGIATDDSEYAPAYYNLQGVQMADPDRLPAGVYIKRTPTQIEKVVVR